MPLGSVNEGVQVEILWLVVNTLVIVSINMAVLSQPKLLVKFDVYFPPAFKAWPFQRYGSWAEQIVSLMIEVSAAFTVRFNVMVLSQPFGVVVLNI